MVLNGIHKLMVLLVLCTTVLEYQVLYLVLRIFLLWTLEAGKTLRKDVLLLTFILVCVKEVEEEDLGVNFAKVVSTMAFFSTFCSINHNYTSVSTTMGRETILRVLTFMIYEE